MNFVKSAGQSCGSTSRLLLHSSLYDAVTSGVAKLMEAIRVGDPRLDATEMGTLSMRSQYDKTLSYISLGQSEGATLLTGGGRPPGLSDGPGLYVAPTLFGDVRPGSRLAREEVFGPVLSCFRWSSEDEAIDLANDVDFGLTASVWTNDIRRAVRVVRSLDAGFIWVNGSAAHFTGVPFGGVKLSGIGREENLDELLSYTQLKAVNVLLS
jgi:2-formylbenzoate dehydrogenase